MTPYYESDGVTIYHGDTLEVLDGLGEFTVDAVLTDPPYASGARTEAARPASGAMLRGQKWEAMPIDNDQMTTLGFVWLIRMVANLCYPMLADGASFVSFIDWRQWPNLVGALETCNYRVQGMVVWNKGSFALGNGFRGQHELVCHAAKGVPTIYDRSTGNVLDADPEGEHLAVLNRVETAPRERPDYHPSPKPVDLLHRLMRVVTPPHGLVLDPFMGAGATLVAAHRHGFKALGIEKVEEYCEIAAARCGAATRVEQPGSLFDSGATADA